MALTALRKGDYHRYLAEFADGDRRNGASEAAHVSYKQATEIAQSDLAPTHPIRLGLALNFRCVAAIRCYADVAACSTTRCALAAER